MKNAIGLNEKKGCPKKLNKTMGGAGPGCRDGEQGKAQHFTGDLNNKGSAKSTKTGGRCLKGGGKRKKRGTSGPPSEDYTKKTTRNL